MKKTILVLLLLSAILPSCKTIGIEDLRPPFSIKHKIPALTPEIDMQGLIGAYSTEGSSLRGGAVQVPVKNIPAIGDASVTGFRAKSASYADARQQDIVTLFERDVKNNICESGKTKGFIELKITFSNPVYRADILNTFLGTLGGGIPFLFGLTSQYAKQTLELEVNIKNADKEVIATYTSSAEAKAVFAMWRGYSVEDKYPGSVKRKANIDAYNEVMADIKEQIQKDYSTLKSKLK